MNKLVVVTGGSKGIGKALVEKFASQGFDVATCARNYEDLKSLKEATERTFSKIKLFTFKADLSKKDECQAFSNFILQLNKPVEVLINNTGTYEPGQIHSETDGVLEKMISTNLYSAYHTSRGLLPSMIQNKNGYVFVVCSTASITPYVNGGSYCISKYALYGMTKVLREEMKEHGIKVTAVLPGATKTSSWDGVDLPDSRFIKPEDVAESIFSIYSLSGNTTVEEILIRPQLGDIV